VKDATFKNFQASNDKIIENCNKRIKSLRQDPKNAPKIAKLERVKMLAERDFMAIPDKRDFYITY